MDFLSNFASDYLASERITVLNISWNVNGKLCDETPLHGMFKYELDLRPDVIAIGIQEMIELSAANVVGSEITGIAMERASTWQKCVLETINEYDNEETYYVVGSCHMVGLWICVLCNDVFAPFISNVQTSSLARGVGGFGNKGGLCVRFDILDTSICFVNTHLTAHRENATKRNDDANAILTDSIFQDVFNKPAQSQVEYNLSSSDTTRTQHQQHQLRHRLAKVSLGMEFDNIASEVAPDESVEPKPLLLPLSAMKDEQYKFAVDHHDIIIWMGDLNSRLLNEIDMTGAHEMINDNNTSSLFEYDQLVHDMRAGRVLSGFMEGDIRFAPTYPFVPGTNDYDRRPDKKERLPAWCDRVLWRVAAGGRGSTGGGQWPISDNNINHGNKNNNNDISNSGKGATTAENDVHVQQGEADIENVQVQASSSSCAWASSVLHRESEKVELIFYESCPLFNTSDHKPVRALFNVRIKRVDWALRELFLMENTMNYRPMVASLQGDALSSQCLSDLVQVCPTHVLLHSQPPLGDQCKVEFVNKSKLTVQVAPSLSDLPGWLKLCPLNLLMTPGSSHEVMITVDHSLASLCFGQSDGHSCVQYDNSPRGDVQDQGFHESEHADKRATANHHSNQPAHHNDKHKHFRIQSLTNQYKSQSTQSVSELKSVLCGRILIPELTAVLKFKLSSDLNTDESSPKPGSVSASVCGVETCTTLTDEVIVPLVCSMGPEPIQKPQIKRTK